TGFKIYRDESLVATLDDPLTTNYQISGLANSQDYSVRITTIDAAGNESAGVSATATTAEIFTTAEPGEVIFSEIGWAGSTTSSADEWLELQNISNKIFNLAGWKILGAATSGGDFEIPAGTLEPGEFFVVANYSADDSALAIDPDFVSTNLSLSNSSFEIILKDYAGTTVDSAGDGGAPPAGASGATPASMLRTPDLSGWRTATESVNFDTAANLGNPGVANFRDDDVVFAALSANPANPLPGETTIFTARIENVGLNSASFDLIWKVDGTEVSRETISALESFATVEKVSSESFNSNAVVSATLDFPADENSVDNSATLNLSVTNHLVINEFVPDPVGSDTGAEWIELFNPTDSAIALAGWKINSTALSGSIEPGGFFVLDHFTGLTNTDDTVELFNGDMLVDSKNFENSVEGKSFGRDSTNLSTWTEFWHPTKNVANIEQNQTPTAVITIQGSGNTMGACSLFVNLTAENSADPDGDALDFEWDFGNSETSDEENPSGFYFVPGTYTVQLTAIDPLGDAATTTQIFRVAECGGGGGATAVKNSTTQSNEPIYNSVSADRVQLKINEVAFNSSPDWVEVFVVNDGNDGAGIDLGGFYFEDDKRIKTIRPRTILRTGEFLILEFKAADPAAVEYGAGFIKIFSDRAGLTATDEQIILRDSTGKIEDAVVWENRDGKWSKGEDVDVAAIVEQGAWVSNALTDAFDSSEIKHDVVLARDSAVFDSDSAADWFATLLATPGQKNSLRPVRADDFNFQISKVAPKNPTGDLVEITCRDCAEPVSLAGFSLCNSTEGVIFTFPLDAKISATKPLQIIFSSNPEETKDGVFYTASHGLAGRDDFISLRDTQNLVADFVGWSDRAISPMRVERDLSTSQLNQLKRVFLDGFWSSDEPNSLLDSRALSLGGSFVRNNSADTNSAADFIIIPPETPLEKIATGSGNIVISEIFANPDGTDAGNEWFELANRGEKPVELFGWSVGIASSFFEFENSVVLAPGEFRAFRSLLPLRNSASTIFLLDPDGELIDSVEYPDAKVGIAFARNAADEFFTTELPTPDAPNGFFQILDPDDDTDGDGFENSAESAYGTDPENFDTDGDSLPDFFEMQNNSDPLVPDATLEKLRQYRAELSALAGSQFASSTDSGGIFLSGVGVPGGRARLFIQSELNVVEIPVDADGNWNYALDRPLAAGAHHIFAQLIDPRGVEGVAKKVWAFALAQNFTPPTFADTIRISEILPNPTGKDAGDEFVELENFGAEVADISNFTLSVGRKKFTFPTNSLVQPSEFLLLRSDATNLTLTNAGGVLALAWPTGRVVDSLRYPKLGEGIAFARDEDEFFATKTLTPGAANAILAPKQKSSKSSAKFANGNLSDTIRISEILANPIGSDTKTEFIELENFGSRSVNLGNWQISDRQKTIRLPDSLVLHPGEIKTLPRSLTKISLNNSGREKVQIADFRGKVIDLLEFESPPEGVALAFDGSEIRETEIPTPGATNQFDTQKLVGTVEFRGDDGFVVQTDSGETFVQFGESSSALLARALFRDGSRYEIFVKSEKGELILSGFQPDPNYLSADLLALDANQKNSQPTWPFVLLVFSVIFVGLRFARVGEWLAAFREKLNQ
ncbi:MAG: lamin tail domain-containing protein, partial [Patescibacteria group bacterium]